MILRAASGFLPTGFNLGLAGMVGGGLTPNNNNAYSNIGETTTLSVSGVLGHKIDLKDIKGMSNK